MSDAPPPFTDLVRNGWLARLPPKAQAYAHLMRLDRPIGTWLLLLPCWWSLILATQDAWPFSTMALFGLGAVLLRGAGCIINDLWDRDIDGQVERTRTRPLASGALSPREALAFLALLLALGLIILTQFNKTTIVWGLAAILPVTFYPLAKRFFVAPQLILGLTFNWGALLGWIALRGTLETPALLLYAGGIFWTLGYDTIYAHQDIRDDKTLGLKSLALTLKSHAKAWIGTFYLIALAFFAAAGVKAGLSPLYLLSLSPASAHAFWLWHKWDPESPSSSLATFRANRDFGFLLMAALWIGKISSL